VNAGARSGERNAPDSEDPVLREERRVLALGAREFDAGRFFEAHEHFETGWRAARARSDAASDVWRALVLVAGAWHHHVAGRAKGQAMLKVKARVCLSRALANAALEDVWRERAQRIDVLLDAHEPPLIAAALTPLE
jgi:predicted metal-dependent hydrolase